MKHYFTDLVIKRRWAEKSRGHYGRVGSAFNGRTRQNLQSVFILLQYAMVGVLFLSRRNTSKTTTRSLPEAIKP